MDAKRVLDSVLADGQSMASGVFGEALDKAEQHLDVPEQGPERDAMISGMKTGAVAAGALAILLGTRAGRRLGGAALKLGSVAAVGGLAYNAWQRWEKNVQGGRVKTIEPADRSATASPIDKVDEDPQQQRSVVLLRAMIAAAQADGHIDAAEKQVIMDKMGNQNFDAELLDFIRSEIENPPTVETLASLAGSETEAAEMYLAARIVIDQTNDDERQWLTSLQQSLNLQPGLVTEMEKEIA
jgi:uncharacterized membrane protein YebE (DUF533 family)